jgi:hypothetical protein
MIYVDVCYIQNILMTNKNKDLDIYVCNSSAL